MSWKQEKIEAEKAFRKIHGNLKHIPDEFCMWNKKMGASVCRKSLTDYKDFFDFMKNHELKHNLAELKMCFDYHLSLYLLISPGLIFRRHHEFVIYQIAASIFEGIMLDYLEHKASESGDSLFKNLMQEKVIKNKSIGLGALCEIFYNSKLFAVRDDHNKGWYQYLLEVNHLRNTIHPKSFNKKEALRGSNKVLDSGFDNIQINLENFIKNIKKKY